MKDIIQYILGFSFFQKTEGMKGAYMLIGCHPKFSTTWHWAIDWFAPWASFKPNGKSFQFRKQKIQRRITTDSTGQPPVAG